MAFARQAKLAESGCKMLYPDSLFSLFFPAGMWCVVSTPLMWRAFVGGGRRDVGKSYFFCVFSVVSSHACSIALQEDLHRCGTTTPV